MSPPTLSPKEWVALGNRLTELASKMLRKWTGRASPEDAEDLAQDAIAQLYDDGYAPWDPAKDPELFDHLAKVVFGLVKNKRKASSIRDKHARDEQKDAQRDPAAESPRTPEREAEARELADRTLTEIEEALAADAHGLLISRCYREGVYVAADQAAHVGLAIEDVRRARRRFFDAADVVRIRLDGVASEGGDE